MKLLNQPNKFKEKTYTKVNFYKIDENNHEMNNDTNLNTNLNWYKSDINLNRTNVSTKSIHPKNYK